MAGDPQAKFYWDIALKASSDLPQILYRRELGKFLFSTNAMDLGRGEFKKAVNSLVGNTDSYRWELMWTYFEWARQEMKKASDGEEAYRYFISALKVIKELRDEERKKNAQQIIKEQWDSLFPDKVKFPGEGSLPQTFSQLEVAKPESSAK